MKMRFAWGTNLNGGTCACGGGGGGGTIDEAILYNDKVDKCLCLCLLLYLSRRELDSWIKKQDIFVVSPTPFMKKMVDLLTSKKQSSKHP